MSNLSNLEPLNILVKLTARAFYGEIGDNEPYIRDRSNNNKAVSQAEFFLNALTRYQWVCERDLVKDLRDSRYQLVCDRDSVKDLIDSRYQWVRERDLVTDAIVSSKILLQTMWFLHKEKLVKFERKAEILKPVRRLHAAGVDAQHDRREGDEKTLPLFHRRGYHIYWCLDYGQIYSVVRYKINCLKIKLNKELYSKRRMQKHLCSNCEERYTILNAEWPFYDDCETVVSDKSHGQLVVESDKLVTQGVGGNVDDNVKSCDKLNEVLQKIEEQLMPLVKQLDRVQEMAVPDFGILAAREVETKTISTNESEIDAINSRVEELKLVNQVNSSNKKFKMDVTSDPSGDRKSSQVPLMPSVKQMQDRAQAALMLAKQMQDQVLNGAENRRVERSKGVKQYVNSSNKSKITSAPSGSKINSQVAAVALMRANQMQDQILIDAEKLKHVMQYVYNLGPCTSSIPQLGMKRKHGVENKKEVTTPGRCLSLFCKKECRCSKLGYMNCTVFFHMIWPYTNRDKLQVFASSASNTISCIRICSAVQLDFKHFSKCGVDITFVQYH